MEVLYDGDRREDYIRGEREKRGLLGMRPTLCALKPIFISIGHRISLATALKIVKMTCNYRVPEPIRQADIRSREYLRNHPLVSPNP